MKTFILLISICAALMAYTDVPAAETGSFVTSSDKVAPYANTQTLGRRMLDGLVYQEMIKNAAKRNVDLTKYPVDPRAEKWRVYVPATPGDNGKYGLLLWITDQDEFAAPESWQKILDEQHIIFISPVNAGEDDDLIFRRAALGLLGMNWTLSNYSLDTTTLLIGGDGSGANVAEAMAIAYGDIFTGALLTSKEHADAVRPAPTPHPTIAERIATRSRFVIPIDSNSTAFTNMMNTDHCIPTSNIDASIETNNLAGSLGKSLEFLRKPTQIDPRECLVQQRIAANKAIKEVKYNMENLKVAEAVDSLLMAHHKYGVLIENDVVALATEMREKYARQYMRASEDFMKNNANILDFRSTAESMATAAESRSNFQNENNNK